MRADVARFDLDAYEKMLGAAQAAHYRFVGFDQVDEPRDVPVCLLRHDIDSELWGCLPMARVEARLGIKATYFVMMRATAYNPFCVESLEVVAELLRLGHEIGLHFMGELTRDVALATVAERVQDEVGILEREYGTRVHGFSYHQPDERLLSEEVEVPGLVNTYSKRQLGAYTYVSDSNMCWRREHPVDIFNQRLFLRLQLLIHPMWWLGDPGPFPEKWRQVLRTCRDTIVAHWTSREGTLVDVPPARLTDGL